MRSIGILNFILFFLVAGIAAQKKQLIPPGTVQINDTLFADKLEVDNVGWREYLFYLRRFDSAEQEKALPDTLVWGSDSSSKAMQEYYFRHPGFSNYPVVGISYQQALAFCAWRTAQVNFGYYIKENKITDWENHLKDPYPIRLYYRLPTEKEWEWLAAGDKPGAAYPYGIDSVYRKWKKEYRKTFNCRYPEDTLASQQAKQIRYYTTAGGSFWPNSSHLYNMIGNVAEMVQEEGIAKGGSFHHQLEECKIKNNQPYTGPERWLGFRCVAVILK